MTMLSLAHLRRALQATLAVHPENAPLRLALSGGLDSCLLLHLLASEPYWRARLEAIHVHHGLSPHADEWAQFCCDLGGRLGVPVRVERVQLTPGNGESLEAQARTARYGALARHLPAGGLLLTAHHGDDQLETLLLALKRGSGPTGLAGIRPRQSFAGGQLLRPLLDFARQDLAALASEMGMIWVEDESNGDDRFDRNFVRLHLAPLLRARWPAILQTAGRSMSLCAEAADLLDELAVDDGAQAVTTQGLSIVAAARLSPARRANLLRHWLKSQGAALPSRDQLALIWLEVAQAREDANPCLAWEHWSVRRHQGHLILLARESGEAEPLAWQGEIGIDTPLTLPANLGSLLLRPDMAGALRLPRPDEPLSVRFTVAPGSRLHPVGRSGSRRLKKLWQEYGVPSWQRGRIPILFYGDAPAAVLGLFVCQPFARREGEGLSWHWQP